MFTCHCASVYMIGCCLICVVDVYLLFFVVVGGCFFFFFFKQKTAYEMRVSDWSSDVCSSDLFVQRSASARLWRWIVTRRAHHPVTVQALGRRALCAGRSSFGGRGNPRARASELMSH